MRRFLLSTGLALAVGGSVLGAAATLPITAPPLSAGSAIVASCDPDGFTLGWSTWWNPGSQRFEMIGVQVHDIADLCFQRYTEVVLTGGGGTLAFTSNVSWQWFGGDSNYAFVDFLAFEIPVSAVEDIHIQVY